MKYIEPYDKVKVFFKNGVLIEGQVDTWTHKEAVLFNDQNEMFIIQDTTADVLCVKVTKYVSDVKDTKQDSYPIPSNNDYEEVDMGDLAQEVEEIKSKPIDQLSLMRLAELKKLQSIEDRKAIENKLKSHTINTTQKVQYGIPGFFKK